MKVYDVKFGITKNLGDFNSERIDFASIVEEGECPLEVLAILKELVKGNKPASIKAEAITIAETKAPKEEVKVEKEEVVEEEAPAKEEKPVKKNAPAKKTATAPKKTKDVPYDRTIQTHKKLLGELFDEIAPDWRKDADIKPKAIEASKTLLIGEGFLDAKGNIVESFKSKAKKALGV